MILDIHSKNKTLIAELRSALYDYQPSKVLQSISKKSPVIVHQYWKS